MQMKRVQLEQFIKGMVPETYFLLVCHSVTVNNINMEKSLGFPPILSHNPLWMNAKAPCLERTPFWGIQPPVGEGSPGANAVATLGQDALRRSIMSKCAVDGHFLIFLIPFVTFASKIEYLHDAVNQERSKFLLQISIILFLCWIQMIKLLHINIYSLYFAIYITYKCLFCIFD